MEELLRGILRERTWVSLGVATTPEAPASPATGMTAGARMVLVQLAGMDTAPVQCRVVHLGQGLGRGVFTPLLTGDEVVVFYPAGDPNRAVCLGGLGNGRAVNPPANDLLHMLLQHPGGIELRSADGLPAHGIVMGTFLAGLQSYVTAVQALIAQIGTAAGLATDPASAVGAHEGIAAAVLAFNADPAVASFVSQLTTSAAAGTAPGVGGLPYASQLHKVTP